MAAASVLRVGFTTMFAWQAALVAPASALVAASRSLVVGKAFCDVSWAQEEPVGRLGAMSTSTVQGEAGSAFPFPFTSRIGSEVLLAVEPWQGWVAEVAEVASNPTVQAGLTAACLVALGDSVAQGASLVKNRDEARDRMGVEREGDHGLYSVAPPPPWEYYDSRRGAAYFTFGFFYTGVFQHWWFAWLNANVPGLVSVDVAQSPLLLGLTKTLINQLGVVPFLYFPCIFAVTGALADLTPRESVQRLRENLVSLYSRNLGFWLPVQCTMFCAVPEPSQVAFLSAAGVVWTAILSSLTTATTPALAPAPIAVALMTAPDKADTTINAPIVLDTPLLEEVTIGDFQDAINDLFVPDDLGAAVQDLGATLSDLAPKGEAAEPPR